VRGNPVQIFDDIGDREGRVHNVNLADVSARRNDRARSARFRSFPRNAVILLPRGLPLTRALSPECTFLRESRHITSDQWRIP
jgi:hypothetical protein